MRLVCAHEDCSLYGIEREIAGRVEADDERRLCSGRCEDGGRCGRILDLIDGEERKHVPSDRPPPPEPASSPSKAERREAAVERLRGQRDELLRRSDWTQLLDTPLTDAERARWAAYRQSLRDLPATVKDPAAPGWPEVPA